MKNIFINLILFLVAIIAFAILLIPGFLWATYSIAWRKGFSGLHDYFSGLLGTIAIDLDRTGNFMFGTMLNHLFIHKKRAGVYAECVLFYTDRDLYDNYEVHHQFGDIRETVSSVLGKNEKAVNLKPLGMFMVDLLNRIDPNHSEKWIEYYKKSKNKMV